MGNGEIVVLIASNIDDQAVRRAAEERKQKILTIAQNVLSIRPEAIIGIAVNRFFSEKEAKKGDWVFELQQPAVCTCGEMYPVSTILVTSVPHDDIPGKANMTRPLIAWCPVCDRTVDLLNVKAGRIPT